MRDDRSAGAAAMTKRARVFVPKPHIRNKVGTAGGIDLASAGALARPVIERYSAEFLDTVREHLSSLRLSLAGLQSGRSGTRQDRDRVFNAAHEIRGQSGLFGYPLATAVADVLCKAVDRRPLIRVADAPLVQLHVLALLAVFRDDLKGDGGAVGRTLREVLEKVEQHLQRPPRAR
jgi:chemotaxis protein histidine kinase CheA